MLTTNTNQNIRIHFFKEAKVILDARIVQAFG